MKWLKSCLILLVVFSFTGCQPIWTIKRKIKSMFSNEIPDDETDSDYEEVEEKPLQASQRIGKITAESRLFNLMREFSSNGDETFVPVILKQIPISASRFSGAYDDQLVSSMHRFAPLIENRNEKAIDIIATWFTSLNGKNKMEAAKVLAISFDYNLKAFFTKYTILIHKDGCRLVEKIPVTISGNSKSAEYLTARKKKLQALLEDGSLEGYSYTVGQQCLALVTDRIKLYKSTINNL